MQEKISIKVTNSDWSTEYLRPFLNKATYYFPYSWNKESEGIIFMGENFIELFKKEDIDFCVMNIFLNDKGEIIGVKKHNGICIKP